MSEKKTRIVACPHCKKDSVFGEQNPFRPFCSERCHLIDLGLWANEEFKITTPLDPNLLDDDFQSH